MYWQAPELVSCLPKQAAKSKGRKKGMTHEKRFSVICKPLILGSRLLELLVPVLHLNLLCFCATGVPTRQLTCSQAGNGNDSNRPSDKGNRMAQKKRKAEDSCMDPRELPSANVETPSETEEPQVPRAEGGSQSAQPQVETPLPRPLAPIFIKRDPPSEVESHNTDEQALQVDVVCARRRVEPTEGRPARSCQTRKPRAPRRHAKSTKRRPPPLMSLLARCISFEVASQYDPVNVALASSYFSTMHICAAQSYYYPL